MKGCYLEKWLLAGSVLYALLSSPPTAAQIDPDATLPVNSIVTPDGNSNLIKGGTTAGTNLFHSFESFSIPSGGTAFFNNALNIQNILTRVTGGSISNIDGLIRANGTANLFLLNPNGIIFGPNARLNIGGSFIGSTANGLNFADGTFFSATPAPSTSLLTISVPIGLQYGSEAGSVQVKGSSLEVNPGKTLALAGGNVSVDGGQLVARGGHIELAGVAAESSVGFSANGDYLSLSFPQGVPRADVSLTNQAEVNVLAGGGGSITVTARNLSLSEGSILEAGINNGLGFAGAQAGDIQLDVTETINLVNNSTISNAVLVEGTGNAGNINITTGSLSLTRSALNNYTNGQGGAGSVNINARNTVSLDESIIGDGSIVGTTVQPTSVGNAASINITTGSLSLTNGSQLIALLSGRGRAGDVNIVVRDAASLDGVRSSGAPSSILTGVVETAVGDGGNLSITTGSLSLTNRATLSALTLGQGSAGNINITVRDAVLIEGPDRGATGIFTTVGQTGVGDGGTINLKAGSLSIIGDTAIAADTNGQGQGGNINLDIQGTLLLSGGTTAPTGESSRITLGVQPGGFTSGGNLHINAGSLVLTNGGFIKASTQGQADAGNIDIRADRVDISGSVPTSGLPSGLFTSSDTGGNAGDITIHTQTFRIADGAALSARSRGDGQGGNITVNAARTFEAVNGGQLITTAFGQGRAGNITVNAGEQIAIAGSDPNYAARLARFPNPIDPLVANAISETGSASGFFADTEPNSTGRGGGIQIAAERFSVQKGAQLITSTSGSGRAGDITVNAPDIQLSGAASGLFAQTTTSADAGNLTIQPRGNGQSVRVNLQDGAQISASTEGSGRGGTLTISAPESITLTGDGSIIAAETSGSGTGGNLNLTTGTLNIQNQAEVTVSSSGTGSAGSLFVDANQIYLDNQGRIRADTSGGGGNINLRSPLILLRNGSSISTNATGSNIPGGNISIDTDNLVAVPSDNSDISANSRNFRGGNVTIRASGIFGIEFREQPTALSDITATGVSEGTVNIITPGIDPTRGLAELPTEVVDASGAIATGCRDVRDSSFVVTGRGGLPPTPQQALGDDPRWRDWRTPAGVSRQPNTPGNGTLAPSAIPPSTKSALVEATGWVLGADGKVILTASAPNVTSPHRWGQPVNCDGS